MLKNKFILIGLLLVPQFLGAQKVLTIDDCRRMAVENSGELKQKEIKAEMAAYDKKIALSYYTPAISVKGAYLHNGDNINLVSDEQSARLRSAGTTMMDGMDPVMRRIVESLSSKDIAASINSIGAEIDDALHLNVKDVGLVVASLQQPVFAGGKIVASNQMAQMAYELSKSQLEEERDVVILDAETAYWQVVSISAKKALADEYYSLLTKLEKDSQLAVETGVSTKSDALAVKVKVNEAAMMKTKATNGLRLSKMLLCKQIGLPLDSDIRLYDEGTEEIAVPAMSSYKSMEEILDSRPEIKQLTLASGIYDKKAIVAHADLLPTIAFTANYLVSNPNVKNGFQNTFGGTWNVGVVMNVPIFHGMQAFNKTKKAKAESRLYKIKLEDAKKMINLQVSQLRGQWDESYERFSMAKSDMDMAEENIRTAMLGYEEGVVSAGTTLAAQAAWLKAHSEYIDAAIELQTTASKIKKAEGNTL